MNHTSAPDPHAAIPRISRRTAGRSLVTALGLCAWSPGLRTDAAAEALAGDAGPIRLGANENPSGPGPAAVEALRAALREANRYPGQAQPQLVGNLAAHHGVPRDQVLLAPGSGEILRASTLAFTSATRSLVAASPTFEAPARAAAQAGAPIVAVPVQASGSLDLDAMAAKAAGAGLFFVCNPNNPTGGASPAAAVVDFVARVRRVSAEAVILIDEAYFEYMDDPAYATAIPLVGRDPRVIVSRTFSKIHDMAGMRVGYAIGQADVVAAVRRSLRRARSRVRASPPRRPRSQTGRTSSGRRRSIARRAPSRAARSSRPGSR